MSERGLTGRRIPVNRKVRKPQRPTPSPSPSPSPLSRRRRRTPVPQRSSRPVKILVLRRCYSEPALLRVGTKRDDQRIITPPEPELEPEEILFRPLTCTDIFSTTDYSLPQSPNKCFTGFNPVNQDAKVVVNVTVEGSPGPIRTMVKLTCTVEEIINLVVRKYNQEGRTPPIDKDGAATFELHHSYFSLQSLNNYDVIGDFGTRNFYLRKRINKGEMEADSLTLDTIPIPPPLIVFPSFVAAKINKIIRRTRKLWRLLGCLE